MGRGTGGGGGGREGGRAGAKGGDVYRDWRRRPGHPAARAYGRPRPIRQPLLVPRTTEGRGAALASSSPVPAASRNWPRAGRAAPSRQRLACHKRARPHPSHRASGGNHRAGGECATVGGTLCGGHEAPLPTPTAPLRSASPLPTTDTLSVVGATPTATAATTATSTAWKTFLRGGAAGRPAHSVDQPTILSAWATRQTPLRRGSAPQQPSHTSLQCRSGLDLWGGTDTAGVRLSATMQFKQVTVQLLQFDPLLCM